MSRISLCRSHKRLHDCEHDEGFAYSFACTPSSGFDLVSVRCGTVGLSLVQCPGALVWKPRPENSQLWVMVLPLEVGSSGAYEPVVAAPDAFLWKSQRYEKALCVRFGEHDLKRLLPVQEWSLFRQNAQRVRAGQVNPSSLAACESFVRCLINEPKSIPTESLPRVFDQIVAVALEAVLASIRNLDGVDTEGSIVQRGMTSQRIIHRALQVIDAEYAVDLTVQELAERVFTSSRNLQQLFQSQFGESPKRVLRQYRLHQFRRLLMSSDSIAHAASKCGLRHLGRLSQDYLATYGCLPSDQVVSEDLPCDLVNLT